MKKLTKHKAMEAIRQLLKLHKTRTASLYGRATMSSALENLEALGLVARRKERYSGIYEITPEGDARAEAILEVSGLPLRDSKS